MYTALYLLLLLILLVRFENVLCLTYYTTLSSLLGQIEHSIEFYSLAAHPSTRIDTPAKASVSPPLSVCPPPTPGDVQGEAGQDGAPPAGSPRPNPQLQLAALRLRLLPRAGLRRPGDLGTLPAAAGRDALRRVHADGPEHGLQSHGKVGRVQPQRPAAELQSGRRGGDVAPDVPPDP